MTERINKEAKHPVMIFLQGENYNKLKDLIEKRKISRFINEIVEERLQKDEQRHKEQLRQRLVKDYQSQAKSKNFQKESLSWEKSQFTDLGNE